MPRAGLEPATHGSSGHVPSELRNRATTRKRRHMVMSENKWFNEMDGEQASVHEAAVSASVPGLGTGRSCRDEGVDWEELRRLFNADLPRDRAHRLVEAVDSVLGLEHVDDAKAVLALSGDMHQDAFEGEVG